MKTKLLEIGVWIKDHFMLVVVIAALIAIFFLIGTFREFAYGLLRAAITLLAISVFIWIAFKDSIRPWLVGGGLIADFKVVEAKHRLAFFAAVFLAITIIVVEALVHP